MDSPLPIPELVILKGYIAFLVFDSGLLVAREVYIGE